MNSTRHWHSWKQAMYRQHKSRERFSHLHLAFKCLYLIVGVFGISVIDNTCDHSMRTWIRRRWRVSYPVSPPTSCSISAGPRLHGRGQEGRRTEGGERLDSPDSSWWKAAQVLALKEQSWLNPEVSCLLSRGKGAKDCMNGSPFLGAEPIQRSWGWDEEMPQAKWVHRRGKVGEPFWFLCHSNLPRVAVQLGSPQMLWKPMKGVPLSWSQAKGATKKDHFKWEGGEVQNWNLWHLQSILFTSEIFGVGRVS